MQGRAPDGLQRCLAPAHVVRELTGVETVRVDAAVGPVGGPHACLDALGESLSLRERCPALLLQHISSPAPLATDLGDVVTAVDVGDQERACPAPSARPTRHP